MKAFRGITAIPADLNLFLTPILSAAYQKTDGLYKGLNSSIQKLFDVCFKGRFTVC